MPKCEYCGKIPFFTFCASFFIHVENCQRREKRVIFEKINQERHQELILRKELEHQLAVEKLKRENAEKISKIQTNVYNIQTFVCGDQINVMNLYMDYPKTPFFIEAIRLIEENFDINKITDLEKDVLGPLQDTDLPWPLVGGSRNEIYAMLNINPSDLKTSQAYSFIADVIRRLREKMEKIPYPNMILIEEAKSIEKECLESKAQLKI